MSTRRQALEALSFFYAVGALILFLAAAALGRLSVQSLRDVAVAERRVAQAETVADSAQSAEDPQVSAAADAAPPAATVDAEPVHALTSQPEYSPSEAGDE